MVPYNLFRFSDYLLYGLPSFVTGFFFKRKKYYGLEMGTFSNVYCTCKDMHACVKMRMLKVDRKI